MIESIADIKHTYYINLEERKDRNQHVLEQLQKIGIENPIICSSINKAGFRMSGGMELYEHVLKTKKLRAIAMQVLGGGAIPAKEAIEYVCNLPNVESILFGASSKQNIAQTIELIHHFDSKK